MNIDQINQRNKKRTAIFFVVGLIFLTSFILFRRPMLVGLGGAMVGIPLAHFFMPYRSKAYHLFVFVASLSVVLFYIFSLTFLLLGKISIS